MAKTKTKLVYRPIRTWSSSPILWRLFTTDGIRFTPDVFDSAELAAHERRIRDIRYPQLKAAFQYFID